jgi:hypothetical protein
MIHEAWLVERLATAEARVVELEATLREIRQKTSCFETRRRVVVALDGAPPGPPAPPWVPGVNAPKAAPTASVANGPVEDPCPTCGAKK